MTATHHEASGLWFVLGLPVLAALFGRCVLYGAGTIPPAAQALTAAVCTIIIAHLPWPTPAPGARLRPRALGSWSLTTAACAALLAIAQTPTGTWLSLALPLAAGVLMVCAVTGTFALFLHRSVRLSAPAAHRAALATLMLTGTAPLWLAPLAASLSSRVFTDLVIALSPLGYLASLIDYDVLRSAWFYAHTPWGGLRYDYPDPALQTVLYSALALAMAGIATVPGKRGKRKREKGDATLFPKKIEKRVASPFSCPSIRPTCKEVKS